MSGSRIWQNAVGLCTLLLPFAIASSNAAACAQSTGPRVAQNSDGACTVSKPAPQTGPSDIFWYLHTQTTPNPQTVTPPRIIYFSDPKFPPDAPKGEFSGITKVSILIDTNGNPQQIHVEQSLGPNFDKTTIAAAEKFRFKPALKNGKSVPVKICVEINYRR